MQSLTAQFLAGLRFDPEQAATLRAIGEFRGRQELHYRQAPEALAGLLEVAKIESSESSNRLEGVNVPLDRIRRLVVHQAPPRNRSEQEVAGYRDALALIQCPLLLPVRLAPGETREFVSEYLALPDFPRDVPEVRVTYALMAATATAAAPAR